MFNRLLKKEQLKTSIINIILVLATPTVHALKTPLFSYSAFPSIAKAAPYAIEHFSLLKDVLKPAPELIPEDILRACEVLGAAETFYDKAFLKASNPKERKRIRHLLHFINQLKSFKYGSDFQIRNGKENAVLWGALGLLLEQFQKIKGVFSQQVVAIKREISGGAKAQVMCKDL